MKVYPQYLPDLLHQQKRFALSCSQVATYYQEVTGIRVNRETIRRALDRFKGGNSPQKVGMSPT